MNDLSYGIRYGLTLAEKDALCLSLSLFLQVRLISASQYHIQILISFALSQRAEKAAPTSEIIPLWL